MESPQEDVMGRPRHATKFSRTNLAAHGSLEWEWEGGKTKTNQKQNKNKKESKERKNKVRLYWNPTAMSLAEEAEARKVRLAALRAHKAGQIVDGHGG
jgi:hypothetical protein